MICLQFCLRFVEGWTGGFGGVYLHQEPCFRITAVLQLGDTQYPSIGLKAQVSEKWTNVENFRLNVDILCRFRFW